MAEVSFSWLGLGSLKVAAKLTFSSLIFFIEELLLFHFFFYDLPFWRNGREGADGLLRLCRQMIIAKVCFVFSTGSI
jgi:hypothetical protein